ncbi:unnamed protein product [Blepharisma stoltei]|uniref:Uncharacterized protein n=1 Tax=Blepharisma stoltei TaxID=1481888 RepID=A0AAU9INR2_9CILI|nr:unnamed protein product [Blepharisma stoltei]
MTLINLNKIMDPKTRDYLIMIGGGLAIFFLSYEIFSPNSFLNSTSVAGEAAKEGAKAASKTYVSEKLSR